MSNILGMLLRAKVSANRALNLPTLVDDSDGNMNSAAFVDCVVYAAHSSTCISLSVLAFA